VTHLTTYEIVRQVRCETRNALIESMLGFLTDPRNNRTLKKVDDRSFEIGKRIAKAYDEEPDSIMTFDPNSLSGLSRILVTTMYHIGIAYNFDLQGTETNNFDPEVNFLRPLPVASQVGLKLSGNFDRQRQNERQFTITDNAAGLITKVHASHCKRSIARENFVYPIAGRVGMDKVVQDFLELTLFANLSGDGKDVTKVTGPPTMVDQLEFQTTIGGTASPKVTFLPLGSAFSVSDASFGVTAIRQDIHKLTIGLYLDTTGTSAIGGYRAAIFGGNLITASGGIPERGAAKAVEQFLQQKLFRPTIVIKQ
jgi:hypothetical protein